MFFAILIAKLVSPDLIIMSLIGGVFFDKWWAKIISAVIIALLHTAIISGYYNFSIMSFSCAIIVAWIYCWLGGWLKKKFL